MARVGTQTLLTSQSDENHGLKSCLDHWDREQTAVREDTSTEGIKIREHAQWENGLMTSKDGQHSWGEWGVGGTGL